MRRFIDRRKNPKGKSLGNRQRFIRRARAQIKEVVNRAVQERGIADSVSGRTVTIPAKGIWEPRLRHAPTGGTRNRIFSGNKEFVVGDRIRRPKGNGEGLGKEGSDHGEGSDEFQFVLSEAEFLDLFFEDLELPDLVKTELEEITSLKRRRAGFTVSGLPANLDVMRTIRNSLARRIALSRPSRHQVEALQCRIQELEADACEGASGEQLQALYLELELLNKRRRVVPFVDPFDVRYRRSVPKPEPNTKAVMFCLMDVSGSMGEREKDLAKRFFVLLHLFLKRNYERIDIVFIRHTHEAQEVDEDTFFFDAKTGGTVVSSALLRMNEIISDRYRPESWNIYAAQASDGENFQGDSEKCAELLREEIMPRCQYFAYVEILDVREAGLFANPEEGAALWCSYRVIAGEHSNFEMKRIAGPGEIYPVFRELFVKQGSA